jgi:hypothetical protein
VTRPQNISNCIGNNFQIFSSFLPVIVAASAFFLIKKMPVTRRVTVLIRLIAPAAWSARRQLFGVNNFPPVQRDYFFIFFAPH